MYHNHRGEVEMQFFTVNGAAEILERDRRTIARALRNVPPDDESKGRRWKLATIVNAMKGRENRWQSNDKVVAEIEDAHEALAAGLEKMWAAADASGPEAARQVVRDGVGGLVGALDRALERGLEDLKPHEQYLRLGAR
jgi:hypothetical protein